MQNTRKKQRESLLPCTGMCVAGFFLLFHKYFFRAEKTTNVLVD